MFLYDSIIPTDSRRQWFQLTFISIWTHNVEKFCTNVDVRFVTSTFILHRFPVVCLLRPLEFYTFASDNSYFLTANWLKRAISSQASRPRFITIHAKACCIDVAANLSQCHLPTIKSQMKTLHFYKYAQLYLLHVWKTNKMWFVMQVSFIKAFIFLVNQSLFILRLNSKWYKNFLNFLDIDLR